MSYGIIKRAYDKRKYTPLLGYPSDKHQYLLSPLHRGLAVDFGIAHKHSASKLLEYFNKDKVPVYIDILRLYLDTNGYSDITFQNSVDLREAFINEKNIKIEDFFKELKNNKLLEEINTFIKENPSIIEKSNNEREQRSAHVGYPDAILPLEQLNETDLNEWLLKLKEELKNYVDDDFRVNIGLRDYELPNLDNLIINGKRLRLENVFIANDDYAKIINNNDLLLNLSEWVDKYYIEEYAYRFSWNDERVAASLACGLAAFGDSRNFNNKYPDNNSKLLKLYNKLETILESNKNVEDQSPYYYINLLLEAQQPIQPYLKKLLIARFRSDYQEDKTLANRYRALAKDCNIVIKSSKKVL
jgi:hypothetical protein